MQNPLSWRVVPRIPRGIVQYDLPRNKWNLNPSTYDSTNIVVLDISTWRYAWKPSPHAKKLYWTLRLVRGCKILVFRESIRFGKQSGEPEMTILRGTALPMWVTMVNVFASISLRSHPFLPFPLAASFFCWKDAAELYVPGAASPIKRAEITSICGGVEDLWSD